MLPRPNWTTAPFMDTLMSAKMYTAASELIDTPHDSPIYWIPNPNWLFHKIMVNEVITVGDEYGKWAWTPPADGY